MIVVDSSAWLAGLLPNDVYFFETQAFNVWLNRNRIRIAVPAHFTAEVVGMLAQVGQAADFVDDCVAMIQQSGLFEIYPVSLAQGQLASDIVRHAKIRGSDAVFLALAGKLDFPLITWDKQQRQRGALFCRTMTPIEVVRALR